MDQQRFDDLARLLGASGTRRAGIRSVLGGLLGLGAGTAALDADAKRRRHDGADADAGKKRRKKKTCKPACTAGYTCVKVGKKRECQCATGVICGAACCRIGQICQDGQCVAEPEPNTCISLGEACKGVGRPCCDNLACGSGQSGEGDVACWVRKTGRCTSTAECVYGTACEGGNCVGLPNPEPGPGPRPEPQVIDGLGTACDAARGDTCSHPGAVCRAYDGPGAPAGAHCTLPLQYVCTGESDCTCYSCGWVAASQVDGASTSGRTVRTAADLPRLACCGPIGYACQSDRNCCLGAVCVNGTCQSETCDVCPGGSVQCNYTSIAAAYAGKPSGSTITIAPGTYGEPQIDLPGSNVKSMTFRACGIPDPAAPVIWQNFQSTPGSFRGFLIKANNNGSAAALTFQFLTFRENPDTVNQQLSEAMFQLSGSGANGRALITFSGCTLKNSTTSLAALTTNSYTDLVISDSSFENLVANAPTAAAGGGAINCNAAVSAAASIRNTLNVYRTTFAGNANQSSAAEGGGAVYVNNTTALFEGCTFRDNWAKQAGAIGAGNVVHASDLTLTDCTLTGNEARVGGAGSGGQGGGAIRIGPYDTLALSGSTRITQNQSRNDSDTADTARASAILVQTDGVNGTAPVPSVRITGTTATNVDGNTPVPQCATITIANTLTPVSCVTWT